MKQNEAKISTKMTGKNAYQLKVFFFLCLSENIGLCEHIQTWTVLIR